MPLEGDDPLVDDSEIPSIAVTQDNKVQYVDWIWQWLLKTRIDSQISAIRAGLFELIPESSIVIFDEQEFELVVTGLPTIDVSVWKKGTYYSFCGENDQVVQWFWQIMESWTDDMRSKVLVFATGSSRIPADWTLGQANAKSPFVIQMSWFGAGKLPSGFACFNMMYLSSYKSCNELELKLRMAVTEGAGIS